MARSLRKTSSRKPAKKTARRRGRQKKTPNRKPLWLGILLLVAIVVVVVLVLPDDEDTSPPPVVAEKPAPPVVAPPPAASPDDGDADPIGDLIASLPPEGATPSPAQTRRALPPVPAGPKRLAWRDNAVPWVITDGPKIAIVIDDVGLNRTRADQVIGLNAPLTLAFLPYAEGLSALTDKARAAGHELLVHVPMQPSDASTDPGPNALLTGLSDQQIRERLDKNLGRFDDFVGFNNHMGSSFTADTHGMAVVMAEARRQGLLFLDSRTTTATKGWAMARHYGVPVLERDVFLDNVVEETAIYAQLAKAEDYARTHGSAIVIGHPYPETIAVLHDWLKDTGDVTVVPLSALVGRPRAPALAGTQTEGYVAR